MMNSCSAKYLVFKFELSLKFRLNCYNLKLALNLNLWEEYLIKSLSLEIWRILSLKIFKMLHDEFLYDESLNSYHSHIYMLARL